MIWVTRAKACLAGWHRHLHSRPVSRAQSKPATRRGQGSQRVDAAQLGESGHGSAHKGWEKNEADESRGGTTRQKGCKGA